MQGLQYFLLCLVHLITALTNEEKMAIVEKHNFYRSRTDPQAADMKALRWDQTLEDLATSYAAKCIWDHNEERGFRGENLFLMTGSSLDVELGMADWHRERDYYNFTTVTCQEGQMCGHYSQMVWAHTERVGCGEKFCEKVEGFDDSNIHLLVCNYEPPGNFQGEKPYIPGDPCSSCPSSHTCKESLCLDKSLDEEETSTAKTGFMSDMTPTQLGPERTPSQLDTKLTLLQLVSEQTPSQLYMGPTESELIEEVTQYEKISEPKNSELNPDSATSEMVPKSTQSDKVPEATTSKLVSITTRISTVPLDISTPWRREHSSLDGIEQTSIQPTTQVIAHPNEEYISVSVGPLLHLDSTPLIDKTVINKAFSNDEPHVPTEKETIIPMTISEIPTKSARAHGTSLLVDKDSKPSEKEGHIKTNQDKARRKDIQQTSKTSQQKKKLKNMNLTSFKQKNQLSSALRKDYKSGFPDTSDTDFMDYKKRDKTWINQLSTLFGEKATIDAETRDIKDLKLKIKDLLKKRTRLWWNKAALENYLQKDIIPRGLRLQKFPTLDSPDPLFTSRWEEALTKCSRTLLELLIGADRKSLETIETAIDNIKTQIHKILPPTEYTKFSAELDADLSKCEKEVQEIKINKFQRDLQDYNNNKVYRWQNNRRSRNYHRSRSSSSASSISEEICADCFLVARGGRGDSIDLGTTHLKSDTTTTMRNTRSNQKKLETMKTT